MTSKKTIIIFMMVIGLLITNVITAFAVPPLPSSFYGTVKVDGSNVPVGALVSASINGKEFAHTTTVLYQGDTVYSLDVPGDESSTPAVEGGVPGDTITFKINGLAAQETGVWQSGVNVDLNLTIPSMHLVYIPTVLK